MDSLYYTANQINPRIQNRAIRLRSIRTYLARDYSSCDTRPTLECLLHDVEGTYIHVQVPKELVDKFGETFKEGKVYSIKNFDVQSNRLTYKTDKHKFLIKLNNQTIVRESNVVDFPKHMFRLLDFTKVKTKGEVKDNELFDLIGRVITISGTKVVPVNGKPSRLIDFVIEDTKEDRLSVTMWDNHVDAVTPYYNADLKEPLIVIIQLCRVKISEVDEEIRISSSSTATRLLFNHEYPEFAAFIQSMPQFFTPIRSLSLSSRFSGNGTLEEISTKPIKVTSIKDIYEKQEVGEYHIAAEIISVDSGADWWFLACKGNKCGRKLIPTGDGLLQCKHCNRSWAEGNIKYKLKITMMDEDQTAPLLLCDRDSYTLIGETANTLKGRCDENSSLPQEIKDLEGMTMVFGISARKEQFKYESSAFTVTEIRMDEISIQTHCSRFIKKGDTEFIKNLTDQLDFSEHPKEALDDADEVAPSQVEVVDIGDSSNEKEPVKRQKMDDQSSSKSMKKPKIEPEN